MIDTMKTQDEQNEYHREWTAEHRERQREIWRRGSAKYIAKKKATDPEYMDRLRRNNTLRMREQRIHVADMTLEQLQKHQEKNREYMRTYRAKKKAEKLEQQTGGTMKKYQIIGGQYDSQWYGESDSLRGAKNIAGRNKEYWEDVQEWHTPHIYDSEDVQVIEVQGRTIRAPKHGAIPVV